MVGPSGAALVPPAAMVNAIQTGKSSGKFAGCFDPMRFKAIFPDRWAGFLRAHFRSSTEVAAFFGVDDRTARHWLHGTTAPSGSVAIHAIAAIPGALAELMRAA